MLRFASGCPALKESSLACSSGCGNPVTEFTYLRAYIAAPYACEFLADCHSLVW